jgi:hypothetical protein
VSSKGFRLTQNLGFEGASLSLFWVWIDCCSSVVFLVLVPKFFV